jgi:hypothetical protein
LLHYVLPKALLLSKVFQGTLTTNCDLFGIRKTNCGDFEVQSRLNYTNLLKYLK